MISRDTIDKIFNTARIDEVVADYVSLKRRGANLIGLCPFHDEKTPSFTVSPVKGFYKCFGCGKAGHVVNFVMEIEQCSYPDALRKLAQKYHIPIEERELSAEEKQANDDRESMFVLNECANQWFQQQLWNTEEGKVVGLTYFHERGLLDTTIKKFQLGYCPERGNQFYVYAHGRGYLDKFLLNDPETEMGTGLCGKSSEGERIYDRFHGRVMFPIHTRTGKTVAFAGRILVTKENVGKYINSPGSIIYSKTNQLYGFYQARQAISKADVCYLVEGQMDVLSMVQAGIENVVSSGGTALTLPQIRLIRPLTSNITILYDGDAAGIHAALRGIDMFLQEGFAVKVVLLPDGDDPDSFARKHNASDVLQFISDHQQDFIRFKADILSKEVSNDPTKRSEMIRDVMKSVAVIPDIITRQVYIHECSNLFNLQEQVLNIEVSHILLNKGTTTPPLRRVPQPQRPTVMMAPKGKEEAQLYKKQIKLDSNFRNIVQLLLRYGTTLYSVTDNTMTGDFLLTELHKDDLWPTNETYATILTEWEQHHREVGFDGITYFAHHPDINVSQLTIELTMDYDGSLPKQDKLVSTATQLLYELKLTHIEMQLLTLSKQIIVSQDAGDDVQTQSLVAQQQQYYVMQQQLRDYLRLV